MFRRLVLSTVLISLVPSVAFADLRDAIPRAVAAQAGQNANGSSKDNPYFVPSLALLGGGALVTLVGLTHDTGAKCTTTSATFECGTTKSKATIFTGLGMVGAGAYLFYRGKNKANASPQVLVGPQGVSVRQRWAW